MNHLLDLLVQTQIKLPNKGMIPGREGKQASGVHFQASPRLQRAVLAQLRGILAPLIFIERPSEAAFNAPHMCSPLADSELALREASRGSKAIFYFDRQDVMFCSPCRRTL